MGKILFKRRKAQELIHFAFVGPILFLVLFAIMEFGYLLAMKHSMDAAVNTSTENISKFMNISGTEAERISKLEAKVKSDLIFALQMANVPDPIGETDVEVHTTAAGLVLVEATYNYYPMLLVPFGSTNYKITLRTVESVKPQILEPSGNSFLTYPNISLSQDSLMISCSTPPCYGNDTSAYTIAFMVMYPYENDITNDVVFSNTYAKLFSWNGEDLLPANLLLNYKTGYLEVLSPYYMPGGNPGPADISQCTVKTNIPYVWVIASLGYTNVFFTQYNAMSPVSSYHNLFSSGFTYETPMYNDTNPDPNTSYLYKVDVRHYDDRDGFGTVFPSPFKRSLGFRWHNSALVTGIAGLYGTHSVAELALKNMVRAGWYDTGLGNNFGISRVGNTEYIRNTGAHTWLLHLINKYETLNPALDAGGNDTGFRVTLYQPTLVKFNGGLDNPIDQQLLYSTAPAENPIYSTFQPTLYINPDTGVMDNSQPHNTYITSVYLDSDDDGIPDAWDNHPSVADTDGNGELDGFEYRTGLDNTLRDLEGYPYVTLTNQIGYHYIWTYEDAGGDYGLIDPPLDEDFGPIYVLPPHREDGPITTENMVLMRPTTDENTLDLGYVYKDSYETFSAPLDPVTPRIVPQLPFRYDLDIYPAHPELTVAQRINSGATSYTRNRSVQPYSESNMLDIAAMDRYTYANYNGSAFYLKQSQELNILKADKFPDAFGINRIVNEQVPW